jgi:uncharacterized protein
MPEDVRSDTVVKMMRHSSLRTTERQAIEEAVRILENRFRITKVILFGSKARGDDDEHSDIDILLITSEVLHWREEKAVVESLFEVGSAYGVIFSPLFVTASEWNNGVFTEFPIYDEILRDGIVVA